MLQFLLYAEEAVVWERTLMAKFLNVGAWFPLEVAIGRVGPTKIGSVFLGQNFNSPASPKNRAGRAK